MKTPCNHRTPLQAVSLTSSLTPLAELIFCSIVDPNCILPNPLLGYLLNRDITVYISEEEVLNVGLGWHCHWVSWTCTCVHVHDATVLMQRTVNAYRTCKFLLLQSVRIFIHTAQNSTCMQYFSADELTTAKCPKWKTHNSFFLQLRTHVYIIFLLLILSLGVGAIEQLSHPGPRTRIIRSHAAAAAVFKGTLET